MHIFIDESGTFVPASKGRHSVCCVATLAVPDSCLEPVFQLHRTLLGDWDLAGAELKGSALNARRIHRVINSLSTMDVILTIVAMDMGLHTQVEIGEHKKGQADRIRASVAGSEYAQTLREGFYEWAERVENLSNQLYVQATLLSIAVHQTLQTTTLHFAQTEPPTLGSLAWRIDAKDKVITEYEKLWTEIVKPILQTLSLREPLFTVEEFDYSAMAPFENEVREVVPAHLLRGRPPGSPEGPFHSFDVKKFLRDLTFGDSRENGGLQLVDILANAFRRASNGRLDERGWRRVGHLMVRELRTGQAVTCVSMNPGPPVSLPRTPYWSVLKKLNDQARYWEVQTGPQRQAGARA